MRSRGSLNSETQRLETRPHCLGPRPHACACAALPLCASATAPLPRPSPSRLTPRRQRQTHCTRQRPAQLRLPLVARRPCPVLAIWRTSVDREPCPVPRDPSGIQIQAITHSRFTRIGGCACAGRLAPTAYATPASLRSPTAASASTAAPVAQAPSPQAAARFALAGRGSALRSQLCSVQSANLCCVSSLLIY
jgi:hypothetical protein